MTEKHHGEYIPIVATIHDSGLEKLQSGRELDFEVEPPTMEGEPPMRIEVTLRLEDTDDGGSGFRVDGVLK